jgi:predicted nucleotidyltransferase
MTVLADASLQADERVLLNRYVQELRRRLGDELHGVWLFGSRARGEDPDEDSDVDLVVFVDDASWDGRMSVRRVLDDAAHELGLDALAWHFSVHVHTLDWLARRREIRSFFLAELDRDKITLYGTA